MSEPQSSQNDSLRTAVFFIVLVPVIIWLVMYASKKNTESKAKARQCQEQCSAKGYAGYDFQWQMLSGPKCNCLGEPEPKP